ncbi:MAG: single-stranded DNA-binding protein [Candidatus Marinimicrobia bacterium]|nr:single-stranded DNA-binding protein [Candidatus Neomarinimicrobiota bacterium]
MESYSMNKVILIGRLGRDPEVRYTNSGDAVANLSLATTQTWKDKNGERQERTEWHRIVVFRNRAEFAKEYLSKGRLLALEGRLRTRSWEDKNGNKRYTTEVVANTLTPLDSNKDRKSQVSQEPPAELQSDEEEEEIPF